jgi:glutathione S-transferase
MSRNLKIIGSLTSPFVRIARVVCEELGLGYEMELTAFYAKNAPETEALIKNANPLMKVPVLIDGEVSVIDSRVIASYLLQRRGAGKELAKRFPFSIEDENLLTTIYGLLDSGVLWFIMKNTQPGIRTDEGNMARQIERIHSGFAWLEGCEALGRDFGLPEALLVCAMDWLKKRAVADWSAYPRLIALHATFSERPSLVATRIPENA